MERPRSTYTNGGTMKHLLITVIAVAQFLSTKTLAQESTHAKLNSSQLHPIAVSLDQRLLAERFGVIQSAFINYNAKTIQLVIQSAVNCVKGKVCTQMMPIPLEIQLDVVRIVRTQCENVYYAQTPPNVKIKYFEQIKITDPNVGRCAYLQEQAGEVFYRIQTDHAEWINFQMGSGSQLDPM